MSLKTVVFAINTPFALLAAMRYYEKFLYNAYFPIWVLMNSDSERFKNISGINNLPGEVHFYTDKNDSWSLVTDLTLLNNLCSKKIDLLVLQSLKKISNMYLLDRLQHNDGFKLILISDGVVLNTKKKLTNTLIENIKLNYRRLVSSMYHLPFLAMDERRHLHRFDKYFSSKRVTGNEINYFGLDMLLEGANESPLVKSVFNSNFDDVYDIYFFTQPILHQSIIPHSSKILYEQLLLNLSTWAKLYKKRTLIKVHPAENPDSYYKYRNEYCNVFVDPKTPAEIFLSQIHGKVIISCYSSISISNDSDNNFHFWCYPAIHYKLHLTEQFDHIRIIDNFNWFESEIFK